MTVSRVVYSDNCRVLKNACFLPPPTEGHQIPSIAFGTWKLGNGQGPIDAVESALAVGFDHIGEVRHSPRTTVYSPDFLCLTYLHFNFMLIPTYHEKTRHRATETKSKRVRLSGRVGWPVQTCSSQLNGLA